MPNQVRVEGKPEVQRAFSRVAGAAEDMTRANQDVANALLPDVRQGTRKRTGELSQSWEAGASADKAEFTNPLSYSVVQEYGSKRGVEATNAVASAFEAKEDDVSSIYADSIRGSAERAGLRTK